MIIQRLFVFIIPSLLFTARMNSFCWRTSANRTIHYWYNNLSNNSISTFFNPSVKTTDQRLHILTQSYTTGILGSNEQLKHGIVFQDYWLRLRHGATQKSSKGKFRMARCHELLRSDSRLRKNMSCFKWCYISRRYPKTSSPWWQQHTAKVYETTSATLERYPLRRHKGQDEI